MSDLLCADPISTTTTTTTNYFHHKYMELLFRACQLYYLHMRHFKAKLVSHFKLVSPFAIAIAIASVNLLTCVLLLT